MGIVLEVNLREGEEEGKEEGRERFFVCEAVGGRQDFYLEASLIGVATWAPLDIFFSRSCPSPPSACLDGLCARRRRGGHSVQWKARGRFTGQNSGRATLAATRRPHKT
jgi:hypothetical protein